DRELLAEPVRGRGDLLLLRVELPLPLRELLVPPGELRVARAELPLPVGQALVAFLERGRPSDGGLGGLALPGDLGPESLAAGAGLRELALALGERLLAVAELLLVCLDALLAPGERQVARLGAGRRLAGLALERRLGSLDLLVAGGDRARLLREVLGGARALLVGGGQLAELGLDVLLALRGLGLERRKLVVLLHESPPLELERLHLLGDV